MKITKPKAYIILAVSIVLEITGDAALEACSGYRHRLLAVLSFVLIGLSFFLFSKILHIIHLPVAYASWTALGASACALLGATVFGQQLSPTGWLSLAGIIAGTAVLNIKGSADETANTDKEVQNGRPLPASCPQTEDSAASEREE